MQSHIEYRKVVHMAINTYFTVKEMAEMLGVSKQAIYKRMTKDFQPYVVEVDNQKKIKSEILQYIRAEKESTKESTGLKDSTGLKYQDEGNVLGKIIEILEKENNQKQSQIEELQKQLKEEREKRDLMTDKVIELSGQVGNTLQSLTQGQLADKLIEGKKILNEQEGVADLQAEAPPKKKHWWQK